MLRLGEIMGDMRQHGLHKIRVGRRSEQVSRNCCDGMQYMDECTQAPTHLSGHQIEPLTTNILTPFTTLDAGTKPVRSRRLSR